MGNLCFRNNKMKNLILNKIILQQIEKQQLEQIDDEFSFKIIWVNSGTCELIIDLKGTIIREKEFVVLMPENDFLIHSINNGSVSYLSFSVEYLQLEARTFSIDIFKLFIKRTASKIFKIEDDDFGKIEKLKQVLFQFSNKNTFEEQISVNLFNTILLILVNNNHDFVSLPDKYYERIHDFFLLVFEFSKTEKRVTFYSDKLNISSKRLNQILQEFTNKSASYFIHEHLIMEAKKRLVYTDFNINQISEELGFEDVAYFSRFFKRWTTLSPEKYRKKLAQF